MTRPGLCIPADTARFAYDAAGRLTQADNMYARVRRTYTRNGLLASDTLRVRTYYRSAAVGSCDETEPAQGPDPDPPDCPDPTQPCEPGGEPESFGGTIMGGMSPPDLEADFAHHVYVTNRTYDLGGRRLTLTHPLSGGTQTYAYGPGSVLSSVSDPMGNTVGFAYDDALRLRATLYPGNVRRESTYDWDGRMVGDTLFAGGGYALASSLVRDARGRVVTGQVTAAEGGAGGARDVAIWYSGLGAVIRADGLTYANSREDMAVDALWRAGR